MHFGKARIIFPIIISAILLMAPLRDVSKKGKDNHPELLLQLRNSKADTHRVHIYDKLSRHYLNSAGKLKSHADSALYFANKMFYLSQALKYQRGQDDAILLKGDLFIKNNELKSAISLLSTLRDSTRIRFAITLANYYLAKQNKTKADTDSSLAFLQDADKNAKTLSAEKWQNEALHARAIFEFKIGNINAGKRRFKELIDRIDRPGSEEIQASLWQELAKLISSRDNSGITKLYCYQQMAALYKQSGSEAKEIEALKSIADINLVHGRLALAESQLLLVLRRYKAIGYQNIHFVYDLLAVTYRYKGEYSKAIFYGIKTIEGMEATHDTTRAATFYSRLANMYRELGEHEKSLEWYRKVVRKKLLADDSNPYTIRDAGFLARELIKLKREKEALAFMLAYQTNNRPLGIYAEASMTASMAYCYRALHQNRQADRYYTKLITISSQLQNNNEIYTDVYNEIGQYFISKNEYRKAALYLKKALNASEGINSLSETKELYMVLYKADSAAGNYISAMQYLLRHKALNDSIFSIAKSRQIEELQVQYETAQRKKDIEILHNKNEQANDLKNIMLAAAALLLVIIGLLYNRYLIKQRSNRVLEANQKELDRKNHFLQTLNAEQNKLLEEKEWLITEVHHRVKNNLQIVTSLLNTQTAYLKDDAAILAVKDSLRRMQAMSLIHQKLYMDQNTSTISMKEYVNELVCNLQDSFSTGNRITFEQNIEALYLDVASVIPLGLIINEGIVNAIKYAFLNVEMGGVRIDLHRDGAEHILLRISDNGVGLPAGLDIMQDNSLGLDLMQGLTKQLNGVFKIESDHGVHITVRFNLVN
ncbi:histidine kinase dimerization/phosphoacceptor domain -containing protein [Dyadobacter sp. CY351]|uniref:histidine kinase dimerization/phosphoacceptor domain -containing protein n=1 Tax=Dyadobacter sp. CY351 TaxID=2909337 RepID=UPI001F3BB569|nr:histidine kinase dimerization/phosphoacceptor domain -containing protein [Dyadobacter sp. CY351]MCF2518783.1 tetratricopeptide repeat protein [Dyadobacter sp. CY351]